jgi:hypothetical protein
MGFISRAREGYANSLDLEGENAEKVRTKLNSLGQTR